MLGRAQLGASICAVHSFDAAATPLQPGQLWAESGGNTFGESRGGRGRTGRRWMRGAHSNRSLYVSTDSLSSSPTLRCTDRQCRALCSASQDSSCWPHSQWLPPLHAAQKSQCSIPLISKRRRKRPSLAWGWSAIAPCRTQPTLPMPPATLQTFLRAICLRLSTPR